MEVEEEGPEVDDTVAPAVPDIIPYYGVSEQTTASELRVHLVEEKRNNSKCMRSAAALRMTKAGEWAKRADARLRAAKRELKAAKEERDLAEDEIEIAKEDFDWAEGMVGKYDIELMVEQARAGIEQERHVMGVLDGNV